MNFILGVLSHLPLPIRRELRKLLYFYYRHGGRPKARLESTKARDRRKREDFFNRFCQGVGLDIGYGGDFLAPNCTGWDIEHGDAQALLGLKDASFDFVYSSHTLEHMVDPIEAIRSWWRVLKPGGCLLLYIPHRDLYEKKEFLPSRWNGDHKHFFLLDREHLPDTKDIRKLVNQALPDGVIIYAKECAEGHTITEPDIHSDGEYSIEIVIQKAHA